MTVPYNIKSNISAIAMNTYGLPTSGHPCDTTEQIRIDCMIRQRPQKSLWLPRNTLVCFKSQGIYI